MISRKARLAMTLVLVTSATAQADGLSSSTSADDFFQDYTPPRARANSLSVEFGGRAAAYSVNYDRVLEDHLSVGAGISTFGSTLADVRPDRQIGRAHV